MAAAKEAKNILRKEMKRRISRMSIEEKQRQSTQVATKLFAMKEFNDSSRISVFLSMKDEIDTFTIMERIFELKKQCFIPHYIGSKMNMVELKSFSDYVSLPVTNWNIKQPSDDDIRPDAMDTGGLDLIIVPGLAFTKQGHRLGRGKGYYDKYIVKYNRNGFVSPITIALAFNVQICDFVPTSSNDVAINHVIYSD